MSDRPQEISALPFTPEWRDEVLAYARTETYKPRWPYMRMDDGRIAAIVPPWLAEQMREADDA